MEVGGIGISADWASQGPHAHQGGHPFSSHSTLILLVRNTQPASTLFIQASQQDQDVTIKAARCGKNRTMIPSHFWQHFLIGK